VKAITIAPSSGLSIQKLGRLANAMRSVLPVLSGTAILIFAGSGYAQYRFGSIEAARAYAGGSRILVDHPVQSIALEPNSSEIRLEYKLTNLENEPIALIGSNNSCSCTIVDDLPKEIRAGESVIIAARIKIDEKTAAEGTRGAIKIFTAHTQSSEISLEYILSGFGIQSYEPKNHGLTSN
jgi:hypothetical protein